MAATAVSIAALASEPAFCAETWNDSSSVPTMAITHVFFIIIDQDFGFENGAIVHPVARSRRHFGPKLSASPIGPTDPPAEAEASLDPPRPQLRPLHGRST